MIKLGDLVMVNSEWRVEDGLTIWFNRGLGKRKHVFVGNIILNSFGDNMRDLTVSSFYDNVVVVKEDI